MKRFWTRFIGWLVIAVLLQSAAAAGVRFTMARWSNAEVAIWSKQTAYVRSVPGEGEYAPLLILGDSRPFGGIRHSDLVPGARSLALPGSSAIDAYYQLENYLERYPAPRLVILSIAPEHMVFAEQTFFDWSVRAGSVDLRQAREVIELRREVGGYLRPFGLDYWADRVLLRLYDLKMFAFYRSILLTLNPKSVQSARELSMKLDNRYAYDYGTDRRRSKELNAEARMGRFDPDPTLDAYLLKIFELAESRKVLVAYEVMPMNEASYEALRPQYKKDFENYLRYAAKRAPANTYVHVGIPRYPNEFFSDPSHLNVRGADRFTRVLARRYEKILREVRERPRVPDGWSERGIVLR
jgi:hypothetical protein